MIPGERTQKLKKLTKMQNNDLKITRNYTPEEWEMMLALMSKQVRIDNQESTKHTKKTLNLSKKN
jgi:hypothetical protein